MRFTLTALITAVLALNAQAANLIAFSGETCDGAEGKEVGCNGECISFSGRHSFTILGGSANVVAFSFEGCKGPALELGILGAGTCTHVNTGGAVGAILCG
ncbi:hypothetical protein R3P38DRAFT_3293664 [Favolaschia claudopus]|uniref:Uncharacterized protein n=1 Tax=Favolaschia claudopus TaxID=2862362 RepID=A0AAV9ZHE5_9AGAR